MHRDHDTFVKSIRDKKKVKLTFVSNKRGEIRDGLFGPIFHSTSVSEDDSDCYYLWDFESDTGNHFLGLPPSQIVRIKLTKEPFDLVEFFTSRRDTSDSQCASGVDISNRKETDGKSL
ncbi:MAG: hypothetical protein ACYS32_01190 [Planctomycetota bacterium]|jgi:hypothetical protein